MRVEQHQHTEVPQLTPGQVKSIVAVGSQLPSMESTVDFLKGNTSKIFDVAYVTLVRTLEIAAGMYLVGGFRDKEVNPWRRAIGGSLAVQAFVIAYAIYSQGNRSVDLPSSKSAQSVVNGEQGSFQTATLHWLGRAVIVGSGMYLAGGRNHLAKQALAGAAVLEATLLLWAMKNKQVAAAEANEIVK